MPTPRKHQISLDATPYYHYTSRCVRRAFLFGLDPFSGKDYEHRRQWVEDRILLFGEVFCIGICAYAVMSNHHHLVLHINMAEAHSLSDLEVCERWHKLYEGTLLTQRFVKGESLDEVEKPDTLKLAEFVGNPREPMPQGLPFHLKDYIELVDLTGRAIRENKRGYIDDQLPSILERLDIRPREWLVLTTQFESKFKSLVGCKAKLLHAASTMGLKRRPAYGNCEAILH